MNVYVGYVKMNHLRALRKCVPSLRYMSKNSTHFGYKSVTEKEKAERVHQVFVNVAKSYDSMNDAMSFGIHRFWKDAMVQTLDLQSEISLLDVAGGTGDIALRVLKAFERTEPRIRGHLNVTVCDINQSMLDIGISHAKRLNLDNLSWVCGDAENLPFPSDSFNVYTIAFGIRNCIHINTVLEEAYRVLKPGGRFLCLEFSRVNHKVLRKMYDAYSFQIIPVMGEIIAGDWNSYQYLVESIRKFPEQELFAEAISEAGFKSVTYFNMTFGTVAIHSGFKL